MSIPAETSLSGVGSPIDPTYLATTTSPITSALATIGPSGSDGLTLWQVTASQTFTLSSRNVVVLPVFTPPSYTVAVLVSSGGGSLPYPTETSIGVLESPLSSSIDPAYTRCEERSVSENNVRC